MTKLLIDDEDALWTVATTNFEEEIAKKTLLSILLLSILSIFSKHNFDNIVYGAILLIVIAILFCISSDGSSYEIRIASSTLGAGAIGYLFNAANKRTGMVDALASDILSLGRVFVAGDIVGSFTKLLESGEEIAVPHGFAAVAREEDYFKVYDTYMNEIGNLQSDVVQNITAFYTFLKAARDATRSLSMWKDEGYDDEMKKGDLVHIVYLCMLYAIHGGLATRGLYEDRYMIKYAHGIFLAVQVDCLNFLSKFIGKKDYRKALVERRVEMHKRVLDYQTRIFIPPPRDALVSQAAARSN